LNYTRNSFHSPSFCLGRIVDAELATVSGISLIANPTSNRRS